MSDAIDARNVRPTLLAQLPVAEKRFELDHISTAVLVAGSGAPLLLLHGPGEHALKWFNVLPQLAATHTVLAPDLPGHGETEVRGGELSVDRVLKWLDALVDATCSEPPILAGQVVGGAIALRYAARYPDRVARLILIDTLGLVPLRPEPLFQQAMMRYLAQPDEATYEQLWEECASDAGALRQRLGAQWNQVRRYNLDRMRAASLQPHFHTLLNEFGFPAIATEVLAGLRVPTSLIWGRDDRATRLQVAQTASARYGWPLFVIDGAGDDPSLEQPEQFLSAFRSAAELDAALHA